MEQNRDHRNRPTQIRSTDFLAKVQKQFNGGRIAFSTNNTRAIEHLQTKNLLLHPKPYAKIISEWIFRARQRAPRLVQKQDP